MLRHVITVVAMGCVSACSNTGITSKFIALSTTDVEMLNLVEAPAGHITGTLVVSAVDTDGRRERDTTRNVTGSLYNNGVSLQVDNGILERPTVLVGELRGDTLALTAGKSAITFTRADEQRYTDALTALDHEGSLLKIYAGAKAAVATFGHEQERLQSDLAAFTQWSQQRIQHVPDVQKWYGTRIGQYQKCQDTITPLVAKGVPVWKWQQCAIQIDNDGERRQQESGAVDDLQQQEKTAEQALSARIAGIPKQLADLSATMDATCPLAKDPSGCQKNVAKLLQQGPVDFQKTKAITDYQAILPAIHHALATDVQTAAAGEKQLAGIAASTHKLYCCH